MKKLVACIKTLGTRTIKTRFVLVDTKTEECTDVNVALYEAIKKRGEEIKKQGKYATPVLYEYKEPYMVYSFGCGLTHYLEDDILEELAKYDSLFEGATVSALTPNDLKHILGVKNADDERLKEAVLKYYINRYY